MRKIALLLALIVTTQMSFAYVEEYTTSDIKTLTGTGYSQSALKVIETSRITKQGAEKDYVPFYSTEIYSDNPIVKWYQVAKRYVDPAQNSNFFGTREINYENSWHPDGPSAIEFKTPNDKFIRHKEKNIKRLDYTGKVIEGSNGIENPDAIKKDVNDIYIAPVEVEVEDL